MNPDFHDVLRELRAAEARFLIVGAFAVSYHSEPRATGDLDILVEPTAENASRVYRALGAFGAPLTDLSQADLARPGLVFQMGLPPRRIDILTEITGVSFEEAWAERSQVTYGGITAPVIGWRALIKNKLALARPRDLEDVTVLRRHHPS
ncbi:MAG: hypothetical protein ACREJ9_12720 [Candidatus Rokuibacteriota bacterium]